MGSNVVATVDLRRRVMLVLSRRSLEEKLGAYVDISTCGPNMTKTVAKTNVAVQVDGIFNWDHDFHINTDPESIKGHLRLQVIAKKPTDDDDLLILIGEAIVPALDLLAGGGEYDLKTKSGEVQGKLIISKLSPNCQQQTEISPVFQQEIEIVAPEKKKKNKYGFAKRVAERVAATGIASAAAAAFSCFCRSAVEEDPVEEE